jgi:hypothetical protein
MAGKLDLDPDSAAAMEMRRMERLQEETASLEQKKREKTIAEVYKVVGRIQTGKLVEKFTFVSTLVWLKEIKESKFYRDLPHVGTWETFCEYLGMSRRKVDEDIQNLKVFGEEFLAMCRQFSVSYRDLRRLRYATCEGDLVINSGEIVLGDDKIPLTPEHAEDIEAAILGLLDVKQKKIDEQAITLKAKDRIIKGKDEVINKQEGEITKHEKHLHQTKLHPGEEAFLQELSQIKGAFDLWEGRLNLDVVDLHEASPKMRAEYIATLEYIAEIIDDLYQSAVDVYGAASNHRSDYVLPSAHQATEGDIGDKG